MTAFLDESKITEEVHSGLTYVGYAWPGTATSDAKWKIKRISSTATITTVEYALPARGSNSVTNYFIFAWDDRASLPNWG